MTDSLQLPHEVDIDPMSTPPQQPSNQQSSEECYPLGKGYILILYYTKPQDSADASATAIDIRRIKKTFVVNYSINLMPTWQCVNLNKGTFF